jgi:hemerythrin superfamily protein
MAWTLIAFGGAGSEVSPECKKITRPAVARTWNRSRDFALIGQRQETFRMTDARIFKDLKADHDRHRDMLAKLGETSGDSEERRTLFGDLRKELQAHAAAEEESLYAPMLADPDLRDDARHSVAEHKEVDDMLGELVETDMSSPAWLTKFKDMRHRYLHHIDEEEEEMFPNAEDGLSDAAEKKAADTFEERKPKELAMAEDELPGDARE